VCVLLSMPISSSSTSTVARVDRRVKSDELAWGQHGLPAEARVLNLWSSKVDVVQVWERAEV
jgi:hypothetical protein